MADFELKGSRVFVDGRKAGWLTRTADSKLVFISPRRRSRHYFRIYEGWGISEALLNFLSEKGFDIVQIRLGKTETLAVSVETWKDKGIPYHKDGFEEQLILPEKHFKRLETTLSELMETT